MRTCSATALAFGLIATPLLAQQARRGLTLTDYYLLENASAAVISPDGKSVAVVRSYTNEAENQRRSEIWMAPADGSQPPTRVSTPAFNASNPRFTPDGRLLSFTSRRRGAGETASDVWFLRMDQPGEAFQIAGVEGTPVFSPDNQWIAFTRPTPPDAAPPAPMSDAERRIAERFKGKTIEWIQYRFDGRGYLPDPRDPSATPPEELYVVSRSGGTPRRLTQLGVNVQDIAWRPDSRALAIVANSHERDEYLYERADLWVVDLEGGIKRLTDDGYDHSGPAWSPDGQTLVFRRVQGLSAVITSGQDHGAPVDVYRMPAAGGAMRNLTADWDLLPGQPEWSPDGRFVYFTSGIGGSSHLFRLGTGTGARVEQVTSGERRLLGVTYSARLDRIAYTVTDPMHPAEAFTARVDGTDEHRVTGFSDAFLRTVDLGRTERLAFKSKDGTPVEGWLVLPRGYDSAQGALPLVLQIHGGPHGAYGNDFSFQFQLEAANGYAVLFTNPRGSTGYGEKFLWATWGAWGDLDTQDVLAGVDYVMSRFPIDATRLGVAGYSYGGFLTDWIITQDHRFAAAVAGAGISNWLSDYATSDIPRTKESEFFGPPWEARGLEHLLKQSPVVHAKGVTTATLFVHGESDARVPIEQAEQMYLALAKQRVPVRFVRYPDTYHGGWTPWNTVHRYNEELKWWGRHLEPKRKASD